MSFFVTQLGAQCDGCCAHPGLGWILHKQFPRARQAEGARKEAASFDCASGKPPEADKAVFPRTPWEPLAQPRAEFTSPKPFKDNPFSPNQFYFLTQSQWKEPFDFSDWGTVPNAPKNPLLLSQATLSNAEKNFNLCFCQVLTRSQVKGGGSAGALPPRWQFCENDLFLSLLVISHVSHGVCWYHLSLFALQFEFRHGVVVFFCSAHILYTEYFRESLFLTNPCDEKTQCSIFIIPSKHKPVEADAKSL